MTQTATDSKVLVADPLKCDGCKECEAACVLRHAGNRKIALKRIEVMGSGDGNFYVPSTCRQCTEPPCMSVCPRNAISRDPNLDRVVIDTKQCVGCAMCVSACPTGSMAFAHDLGLPYKCDLCDGEPQCVRVCEKGALKYSASDRLHYPRIRESARTILGAFSRQRARVS